MIPAALLDLLCRMNEPPSRNPLSIKRLLLLFITAYFTGTLAGTFLCYRQPKIYEATATLESPDHVGHPERITRLRARMVARELLLDRRWDCTFDHAVSVVEQSVRLKPSTPGVLVEVRHTDGRDATRIARQVAMDLDTPRRESEMAAKGLQVAPYTSPQAAIARDVTRLKGLLQEDAVKAGYSGIFHLVDMASTGDVKAAAIMNREDFSRRWTMMKDLAPKVGYFNPPGEPLRGPNSSVKVGPTPLEPVSPVPELWINGGRGIASLFAGVLFLAFNRWTPSVLRPHPAKPPRTPKPRTPSPPAVNTDPW